MPNLNLFQVDAFTQRRFGGNPAAVVPLQHWLPDTLLQAIATENNLSETAFFVPDGPRFELRWFTPVAEVRLCGHATLATAHTLFAELAYPGQEIVFETRQAGVLKVSRHPSQPTYIMDFPADLPQPLAEYSHLNAILGLEPISVFEGVEDLLAIVADQDTLDALKPNFALLAQVEKRGLIVSAPGQEVDFVSRCFFPRYGIDEDPVTGSAHTLMTPYWAQRLGKTSLSAQQRSARRGDLLCHLQADRVLLEGAAVTYLKGEIYY